MPNCIAYDPAYAYELAVIIHDGLRRMYQEGENCFYYITVMNEAYHQPALPEGSESGILKGLYRFNACEGEADLNLFGSGALMSEVIAAGELLAEDFSLKSDLWSVTSYSELRRECSDKERWNRLHPDQQPKKCYVEEVLSETDAPVVAVSDYLRLVPEQIRAYVPNRYSVLGTDGYGRSDNREQLRSFFEVNRYHIVVSALKALADEGTIPLERVSEAIARYPINPEKPNPITQ